MRSTERTRSGSPSVNRRRGAPRESARLAFGGSAELVIDIGNQSNGQGHETVHAQHVAIRLGLPIDGIRVVQGDAERLPGGQGTGGSSAISVGGAAITAATYSKPRSPTSSSPALVNAVVDALREFGVRHIDLPLTPEKVWRAIGSLCDASRRRSLASR